MGYAWLAINEASEPVGNLILRVSISVERGTDS
jgi:hypothetical protein